ncbi:MAG: Ig-like domain-containing protein [Candidatus Cloacimonadaceae bacterium]|nr:Ig-like domain-containing protein [Candidatus Cloacimonadaceae bacterium]
MNKVFRALIIIALAIVIHGCGSKKSPTGGAVDSEKPTVLTSLPAAFGQISNGRILIDFSKPMDKSSITQGIYIYPPIADKKITLDKNTVTILINEELKTDTNYYVTLTTRLKDIRGNNLEENQTLVFASGKLNNYRVAGTIEYEYPLDRNSYIQFNLLSADSLIVLSQKISGGAYAIDALNPSDYILRAYIDKNNNGRYDFSIEPWFETKSSIRQATNINMTMAYADTTRPVINNIQLRSNREIQIDFSEAVKSYSNLRISRVHDKTELKIIKQLLLGDKLLLLTAEMDSSAYAIEIIALSDHKANAHPRTLYRFNGTTQKDETPPTIVSANPRNGTSVNDLEPVLEVRFSEIIPLENVMVKLISTEGGEVIAMDIIQADHFVCKFRPKRPLQNYRTHSLIIGSESSDISGNKLESDFKLVFLPLKRDK